MSNNTNPEVNAGVHANVGMDFQKNCTIYLFLENYHSLKNQRYFIILEHLEDIVFGFLNRDELIKIETYQAKKSTSKWSISGVLEIVKKITETSQAILNDPHPKSNNFLQENFFATNNTIELKCKVDKQNYTCTVNETNELNTYSSIDKEIKNKLEQGNKNISFTTENIKNLDTLTFRFIDLGRNTKSQLNQLNGMFVSTFGDSIVDHKAALETFYFALEKIEREFNQKNIAVLNDNKKRIESSEIASIINILTNKKLAYDFWREKGEEICEELNISIFDAKTFELHYENSFDKFKDINESEHQKIYDYIKNNQGIFQTHSTDRACISSFLSSFKREKSSTLLELQLKAAIAAAYIEIKNIL
ncbi:hypothetical protein [Bizionia sp.]|uniref:hypothetical protein n=1 Tax=Bizionia sp. TaxID=1954480 RepID=UPI003A92AEF5